ncbi:MAG: 50S ribosomal protein L17 [Patescibacteria group bacterium]
MAHRKFHRKQGKRRAFIKGLANNLIMKEKIETTVSRAKEIRPVVEKMVSIAKKQQLAGLRILLSRLPSQSAKKLYFDIGPRYKERNGGYLRIVKSAKTRKRDAAPVATIEFIK